MKTGSFSRGLCGLQGTLKKEGIFTNRIEDALADKIDAAVIATPIDTHYEVVRQALESGKHVLCEKPLTQHFEEAKELTCLAEKNELILLTNYTYTFSRGLNHTKEIINNGGIGTLQAMEMSLKHVGRFLKYDVYWLLASHMLSVLDMFTPLEGLSFRRTSFICRETGVILFDGQVRGQISVSINYPLRNSSITFYGSEGTLVYDALESPAINLIQYTRKTKVASNELITKREWFHYDETNNLRHVVNRFADALKTGDMCRENLDRALRVTSVLEAMEGKHLN